MILVLSSQHFPLLILVSDGNVFSVISTFERNQPSSKRFTIHFLERSNSAFICHLSTRQQVHTILQSSVIHFLPLIAMFVQQFLFPLRVSLYVTSSQRFSVRKWVGRFSLVFSTFLCTLARSHNIVPLFLRSSVCKYIRTIIRHC